MIGRLLIAGAAASVLGAVVAQAKPVNLKLTVFIPPTSVSGTYVLKPYSKAIAKETNGDLTIKGYYGGALGRSPFKQYKLVTDGIADIGYVVDIYTSGQFPDNSIFELPYNVRTAKEGSLARWRMFEQGLLRGYQNVKVIGLWLSDMGGIHTRKPFKTLADLKGMKIRASGKVATAFLKHIGAVPVGMAATKVTEAIDRGVLDGLMQSWVGLVTFRTHNVVHHHYESPVGTINFSLVMNKKKWNGLSASQKAAIDKFGGERMARTGGREFDKLGTQRFNKHRNDKDRNFIVVKDPDALARARKEVQPIYDNWVRNTPDGRKKLDALNKLLADIRAGS